MFRALVLFLAIFASASSEAAQSIECINPHQGLIINATLDYKDEGGIVETDLDMRVKYKQGGFDGKLKRETFSHTESPGSVILKGVSAAGNYQFELIMPEKQLKKSFTNLELFAYFTKPFADNQLYPHRIPVSCRASLK